MFKRFRRSRVAQLILALLVFIAVGYFSNAVSSASCERETERWLKDRLVRRPTNWPGRRASSDPAEYSLPWLVAVDYEYVVGTTGGEWGTSYYLTLLGLPIPIHNHIRLQS